MPSFHCSICLDMISSADKPMTTLCGHIYCLNCATFHFTGNPSCAVCRTPQSLDTMIRLYPDWETDELRRVVSPHPDDSMSSSPVSVRSMDRAAEEAVDAVKHAIADRVKKEDALMVCNTFVNSVTHREQPHINTDLLREISFQLTLMSTKIKDDNSRLAKLMKNAKSARSSEKRSNAQLEQHRSVVDTLEKANAQLSAQLDKMHEQIAALEHQCRLSSQDAQRQHVYTDNLEAKLDDMSREVENWKQQAVKAKKKYLVVKGKVEEAKRAALDRDRGRVREASDDLVVLE